MRKVSDLKGYDLHELKHELKLAQFDIIVGEALFNEAQKELLEAKAWRFIILKAIRDFPKPLKESKLPKSVKQLSSKKRYALFNAMIKRLGKDSHVEIYRDRLSGNSVSVKLLCVPKNIRVKARKLCDSVSIKEHDGKECFSYYCPGNGKVHRIERYIFRGVMGAKKPQPCERGRIIKAKFLRSRYEKKSVIQRRLDSWLDHLAACKTCQAFRDSLTHPMPVAID